jgi:iron complex outermembrane receptor protein
VPATDTPTRGWTQFDLWVGGDLAALADAGRTQWLLRLANAGAKLAYNAASVSTVRGLAPLAGRSLTLSLAGSF